MLEASQPTPTTSGVHHHGEPISRERLESLYRSLRQPIRAYLERRLHHNPEVAEDLLHDVFVKIHERAGRVERGDRIESWIWAIARNALVDRQRRQKPSEPIEEAPTEPIDPREVGPLHRTVRAFLDCIGEPYREALVLADLEGVPQTQLAKRLGLSHSGAKSRVQRARSKMAALIQQCCHLEFDRYGNVINYTPRGPKCPGCGPVEPLEAGEPPSESCCDDSSSCSGGPRS